VKTLLLVLIALFLATGPCVALAVLLIVPRIRAVLRWQNDQLASLASAMAELRGKFTEQVTASRLSTLQQDLARRLSILQKEVLRTLSETGAGGADLNAPRGATPDLNSLQTPVGGVDLGQLKELHRQIANSQHLTEGALLHLEAQLTTLNFSLGLSGGPGDIIIGPSDSYEKLDQNWLSIYDTTGRKPAGCAIDGARSRTAVIVTLGQSNIGNHGSGRYVARGRVDNFNLYDGKCYHAEDPLLGASGDGGNVSTRLGDKLIDVGLFDRVVVAPIAMGGTVVEQWSEEGMFNRRIPVLIRRLYDAGLDIDFILWQQGEGNPGAGDNFGRQYRKNLLEVIRTFRKYGVNAPFFVALCTRCGPEPHPNADNIRSGQKGAVNRAIGVFLGPDTDSIGIEHRHDLCHFDETGLDMAASLWLEVIANHQSSAGSHFAVGSAGETTTTEALPARGDRRYGQGTDGAFPSAPQNSRDFVA
jgi:hypothetical protein